ncbi:hypothetical protein GP486_000738 [Trichoglossum hirsutum]|uniref:Uncharacterized protein n=1 Tax=Trichoglossum hirsutum TaxID=265104 RepID=A0A9P8RT97_9PEZI|nr:hypothetical protein GP486_000738 [Trichoglossum hirsutum]
MATGIIIGIAGLINGLAFGILSVLPKMTPDKVDGVDSKVRIAVGLASQMGGDSPYIAAFNEMTQFVGYYDPSGKIETGGFSDFNINQHCDKCRKGQQATYLQIFAGDDAICVAYIGQTWADGTKLGWLGDMGKVCGMPNYYSNIQVEMADGGSHVPYCTWFDRDHSDPTFNVGAIQLHMPAFSKMGQYSAPPENVLCSKPITVAHYDAGRDDSILPSFWGSTRKSRRTLGSSKKDFRPRSSASNSAFNETLIASHLPQHNATALCASPESRGPDFISFDEGVFCDMTNRITWPLCGETITNGCYDWKTHSFVDRKLRKRETDYSNIVEWKSGG